jgi:hypothetical protein
MRNVINTEKQPRWVRRAGAIISQEMSIELVGENHPFEDTIQVLHEGKFCEAIVIPFNHIQLASSIN